MTANERALSDRLVSPHDFDGSGPVPEQVRAAARRIAQLQVMWSLQSADMEQPLTTRELQDLFDAAAIGAEWMRELYEVRKALLARIEVLERVAEAARDAVAALDALAVDDADQTTERGNHAK